MGSPYKVLAADDSLLARKIVARALEESEFELLATAEDGQQAVDLFREHRPDVVLLDVVMPTLTGPDALQAILDIDPQAKVIMISSLGTEDAVSECAGIGAKAFLQKPFDPEQLLNALRLLVGAGDGGAA